MGIDAAKNQWLLEDNKNIRYLPTLILFKEGKSYYFNEPRNFDRVTNQILQISRPTKLLLTMGQTEDFLNSVIKEESGRVLTRHKVLFITDEAEQVKEQIDYFKSLAEQAYYKEDTYFGLVTQKEVVGFLKEKYGSKWFKNDFNTTIIYHRC